MATQNEIKRKLRIKDNCSIDGVIPGMRLGPGIYVLGNNITDEEVFERLKSPEFARAVEAYEEKPEVLAEMRPLPQPPEGERYLREKREKEQKAYRERWPAGRPTQYAID